MGGAIDTDEVLLFRFSVLTSNSHRIHYDLPYARDEEGYPALVVHGPLIASALADLASRESDRSINGFWFRAMAPLFVDETVHVRGWPDGEKVRLEAYRHDGLLAMKATAELAAT